MPKKVDLTNQRFNRLTVLSFSHKNHRSESVWLCQCDCGNQTNVVGWCLTNQNTKSCGCLKVEQAIKTKTKHGQYNTKLYRVWSSMKARCLNPNNKAYASYGGRGINLYSRWEDYNSFHQDMSSGYQEGLDIDRIDNDGDYCPENCRWVTRKENQRNRRCNHVIETPDGNMTLAEASERYNIHYGTISYRMKTLGWDSITAVTTPINVSQSRRKVSKDSPQKGI